MNLYGTFILMSLFGHLYYDFVSCQGKKHFLLAEPVVSTFQMWEMKSSTTVDSQEKRFWP